MELNHSNYTHEKYTEQNQYWCPDSEEYAAASQLLSAIRAGWMLALPRVSARQIWKGGSQPRTIYDFTLIRDAQLMVMPVLSNPFIERYLIDNRIPVSFESASENIVVPE